MNAYVKANGVSPLRPSIGSSGRSAAALMSALLLAVSSCGDPQPDPTGLSKDVFRHGSVDYIGAGCKFAVSIANGSLTIRSTGYCPLAERAGVALTIPGTSVGSYDNTAIFDRFMAQWARYLSAPNEFSASITYIDPHVVSGTFHGTACNVYLIPKTCDVVISNGEFYINY